MSSSDFFTRLERQLIAAAERDVAVSPVRRRFAGLIDGLRPRRLAVALPMVASALVVGVIVAVILSLGGEQPQVEAGRGPLAEPTDGLTVEPLGTAPRLPAPAPTKPPGGGLQTPAPAVPPGTVGPGAAPTPTGPSVFLLNGTTESGIATLTSRRLKQSGVPVAGTGNGPSNDIEQSVIYVDPSASRAARAAQLLGIARIESPLPASLRTLAPGAAVVVVLGADRLGRKDRQVRLRGPGSAQGVVRLPKAGGLSLTAEGLSPSDRYFLWAEDQAGKPFPLGFAAYDRGKREAAGMLTAFPIPLAFTTPGRVFLTREKTKRPNPRSMGPIVLDSGRIGG